MGSILVADDDPTVLCTVADYLVAVGHVVARAADGLQAKAALDRGGINLLITDSQMPGLGGLELLAHVRSLPHPIPVIIASGSWTTGQRQQARALGAARVYAKPVDLAQLARDIEDLVR